MIPKMSWVRNSKSECLHRKNHLLVAYKKKFTEMDRIVDNRIRKNGENIDNAQPGHYN